MAWARSLTQVRRAFASPRGRDYVTIWTIVLLMSGLGFRYLLGLPLYAAVVVLTVVAVAISFYSSGKRLRVPFLVGAFVGLAALSVAWSATRLVSLLAVLVLIVTTFVALAAIRGAGTVPFMALLYRGFQISLFGGIFFEIFVALVVRAPVFPLFNDLNRIVDDHSPSSPMLWSQNMLLEGGPIQGFVGNRNPFGAIALFTAVIAVILMLEGRLRRADALVTLSAAIAVCLLTQSATVTVSALYIVGLLVSALVIRRVREPFKRAYSFATLGTTAIAGVLTLKYRESIFGLFDRDSDATHRTDIWREVMDYASQRPEGWGYVGYWPVWEEPYATIVDSTGVLASHAHNAYLDTWFQMGLVGMVILLVMVTLLFGSAWRLVERASSGDTYIPLGWALLTAALVLQSLTESRLLVEGGWFLLVVLYCSGPQVFRLTMVDPELVHSGDRGEVEPPPSPHGRRFPWPSPATDSHVAEDETCACGSAGPNPHRTAEVAMAPPIPPATRVGQPPT